MAGGPEAAAPRHRDRTIPEGAADPAPTRPARTSERSPRRSRPASGRPDRPRHEFPSAVRADTVHLVCAGGAESALEAADASLTGIGGQLGGATFADGPHLEHVVSFTYRAVRAA